MLPRSLRSAAAALGLAAMALTAVAAGPPPAAADPEVLAALDGTAPLDPITDHTPGTDDRYDLASGCFALYSTEAQAYVTRAGTGFAATATAADAAEPFRLQAFDLGKYLLFASAQDFLAAEGGPAESFEAALDTATERSPITEDTDLPRSIYDDLPDVEEPERPTYDSRTGAVAAAAAPSALAEWIVRDAPEGGFTLHLPVDDRAEEDPGPSDVAGDAPVRGTLTAAAEGGALAVVAPEAADVAAATFTFEPVDTASCATWPEIELNAEGTAPIAANPTDEVRGYLDGHLHMMAFEFIGGRSRCGRPWHPYGVAYALVDCSDHEPGGAGAMLETVLSGAPTHDTAGYPEFTYWPKYDSLTHEQVYYRWFERAWRGGLRMFTNLLVDNNALCELWVYKENSCNEMDGVRLQAQRLRELERYIDAQWGGPGAGWFRIVTDPFEARRTMNEGRLAVVMGIEVSVLFDCGEFLGAPTCTTTDIDEELAAVYDLGVRQMEFVNKFDNGLSGVKGDGGSTGVIVNQGNFSETGHFWKMQTCDEAPETTTHTHDNTQYNVNDDSGGATAPLTGRDAIFGAVLQVAGGTGAAPVYPEGPHCNTIGLSQLGGYLLDRMVQRGMLFDPDHMSAKARHQALDDVEAKGYSGVISSHSWADDLVYERVLQMGGIVTPYAGGASGFASKWRQARDWSSDRYYFGIGWGADTNGFGSQGGPRNPGEGEPAVEYPFTGFGGVTFDQQVSGDQTYDVNTDGVDHYGLYPDWVEDIRVQLDADGDGEGAQFLDDLARGPEAYLQTWERALGIANDACRDDRVDLPTRTELDAVDRGVTDLEVLAILGQPNERADGVFTYCVEGGSAAVTFDDDGRVTRVDRRDEQAAGAGSSAAVAGGVTDTGAASGGQAGGEAGGQAAGASTDGHVGHTHDGVTAAGMQVAAAGRPVADGLRIALLAFGGLVGAATLAARRLGRRLS